MQTAPPPPVCSQCGRIDAKPIAKKLDYLPGKGPWNSEATSATFTYQCMCGAAFTRTVKLEADPPATHK
jgi:hypothetical protein